ncbi:MAG: pilus assembly protein [Alphaproteobacteria bacterium]|nr:pilus assembly protein [Alphaproteobacteria bacterium]MBF0250018.1 pilus assembly protein [Alphaproteobacteria bacterium]
MAFPPLPLRRLTARFRTSESGASAIEFAMISTFLSIILLNIVDIAIYMFHKMEITGAVRAGAQYALVDSENATEALVQGVVEDAVDLVGVVVTVDANLCGCSDGATFACGTDTCGGGTTGRTQTYTAISAVYTHTWIFYPGTIDITADATIRTQ